MKLASGRMWSGLEMKGSLALWILCDISDGFRTLPCLCGPQEEVTSLNWWRNDLVTTLWGQGTFYVWITPNPEAWRSFCLSRMSIIGLEVTVKDTMERSPCVSYQTCGWSSSVFISCTFGRLWGCVPNDFHMRKDSQAQVVFLTLFPCDVVTGKEEKLWETNGCLCEVGFWRFLDRVYRVSMMSSWQGGKHMLWRVERIPIVREPCCSVLLCGFKWFLKKIYLLGK